MPFLRDNKELTEKIKRDLMPVDGITGLDRYNEFETIIRTAFNKSKHILHTTGFEHIEEYILLVKYVETADVSVISLPKDIQNIIATMTSKTYYLIFNNILDRSFEKDGVCGCRACERDRYEKQRPKIYINYINYINDNDLSKYYIEELLDNNTDFVKYNNLLYMTKLLHFIEYFEDVGSLIKNHIHITITQHNEDKDPTLLDLLLQ